MKGETIPDDLKHLVSSARVASYRAGNLLCTPVNEQNVDDALRESRNATAALEALQRRAKGIPAPLKGD